MSISEVLERKNMTQYRLAVQSGVPHTTLSDIMSGKTRIEKCSGETLYKLSSALGVTIEDLISENIEKAAKERS